jgi:hypothetical protein
LWVISALLDPDPDSESGSTDPIESGTNPDPDPQPCLEHQQWIPRGVHVMCKPELRIHAAFFQSTPRIFCQPLFGFVCNMAMFECDEF